MWRFYSWGERRRLFQKNPQFINLLQQTTTNLHLMEVLVGAMYRAKSPRLNFKVLFSLCFLNNGAGAVFLCGRIPFRRSPQVGHSFAFYDRISAVPCGRVRRVVQDLHHSRANTVLGDSARVSCGNSPGGSRPTLLRALECGSRNKGCFYFFEKNLGRWWCPVINTLAPHR